MECTTHLGDAPRMTRPMPRAARAAGTRLLDYLLWMIGFVTPVGLMGREGIRLTLYGTHAMGKGFRWLRYMMGSKGHIGAGTRNELLQLNVIAIKGPLIIRGGIVTAGLRDQGLKLQATRALILEDTRRSGGVCILCRLCRRPSGCSRRLGCTSPIWAWARVRSSAELTVWDRKETLAVLLPARTPGTPRPPPPRPRAENGPTCGTTKALHGPLRASAEAATGRMANAAAKRVQFVGTPVCLGRAR